MILTWRIILLRWNNLRARQTVSPRRAIATDLTSRARAQGRYVLCRHSRKDFILIREFVAYIYLGALKVDPQYPWCFRRMRDANLQLD